MTMTVAIVVGVLGVGLAASQLFRLKRWLRTPPPDASPDDPPP